MLLRSLQSGIVRMLLRSLQPGSCSARCVGKNVPRSCVGNEGCKGFEIVDTDARSLLLSIVVEIVLKGSTEGTAKGAVRAAVAAEWVSLDAFDGDMQAGLQLFIESTLTSICDSGLR